MAEAAANSININNHSSCIPHLAKKYSNIIVYYIYYSNKYGKYYIPYMCTVGHTLTV